MDRYDNGSEGREIPRMNRFYAEYASGQTDGSVGIESSEDSFVNRASGIGTFSESYTEGDFETAGIEQVDFARGDRPRPTISNLGLSISKFIGLN